jgi:hypothetical protein
VQRDAEASSVFFSDYLLRRFRFYDVISSFPPNPNLVLQIKLVRPFWWRQFHGRGLHRLDDRLSIAEIVLPSFWKRGARISPASTDRRDQAPAVFD